VRFKRKTKTCRGGQGISVFVKRRFASRLVKKGEGTMKKGGKKKSWGAPDRKTPLSNEKIHTNPRKAKSDAVVGRKNLSRGGGRKKGKTREEDTAPHRGKDQNLGERCPPNPPLQEKTRNFYTNAKKNHQFMEKGRKKGRRRPNSVTLRKGGVLERTLKTPKDNQVCQRGGNLKSFGAICSPSGVQMDTQVNSIKKRKRAIP